MKVTSRLSALTSQLLSPRSSRQYATMANDLSIKTEYPMLSGYKIPALGFGVRTFSLDK